MILFSDQNYDATVAQTVDLGFHLIIWKKNLLNKFFHYIFVVVKWKRTIHTIAGGTQSDDCAEKLLFVKWINITPRH
jgi:hypothetical protein